MSKLFKLRTWLSLGEAGEHLTGVFGETVSSVGVLRLALDGHLKLSVNFVNHASARLSHRVASEDVRTAIMPCVPLHLADPLARAAYALGYGKHGAYEEPLPADVLAGLKDGRLMHMVVDEKIGDDAFIRFDERVTTVQGIWDLPMIGAERLDVEHKYQLLTFGPEVTLTCLGGAFVENEAGQLAQLQERSPPTPILVNGKFEERTEANDPKYLERKKRSSSHPDNYHPAGALPEDAVIVVRTAAIAQMLSRMADDPGPRPAKESARAKNNLLRTIAMMAKHRYSTELDHPHTIARHLINKANELGVKSNSDDVIAGHIKAALALLESEKT